MPKLFGKSYDRNDLRRRVGDLTQVAGVTPYVLSDGPERGVRALEFYNGGGLRFTVLADRGFDIGPAEYAGVPIAWRSVTGALAPSFYEKEGLGWLRGFHGGLLAGVGLATGGAPSEDQGKQYGLHGRLSYLPARCVSYGAEWQGDEYVLWAKGKVRDVAVYDEQLELTRTITTKAGNHSLLVEDEVENIGFEPAGHIIVYHMNLGFPVVDDESEVLAPALSKTPNNPVPEGAMEKSHRIGPPVHGFPEEVYIMDLAADAAGKVTVAVVNRAFDNGQGLGVSFTWRKDQLPWFWEWKQIAEGMYVIGIEPANCGPKGRGPERAAGHLPILEPGDRRRYSVEISVLKSQEEIAAVERQIKEAVSGEIKRAVTNEVRRAMKK